MKSQGLLLPLVLMLGWGAWAWGFTAHAPQKIRLSGKVYFNGQDSDRRIRMNADPVCMSAHEDPVYSEQIVSQNGGLGNVFIYVKEGVPGKGTRPTTPVELEQKGCVFRPHVLGVQVGQPLLIRNDDPTGHNIHALARVNKEFNFGQPFQGLEITQVFKKPEVMIRIKCDIHPWMVAYIGVLEHPHFAVSDESGNFAIEDLPAGSYLLEAWHEQLGVRSIRVEVEAGSPTTVEFRFD